MLRLPVVMVFVYVIERVFRLVQSTVLVLQYLWKPAIQDLLALVSILSIKFTSTHLIYLCSSSTLEFR